jgi:hypothetical protein
MNVLGLGAGAVLKKTLQVGVETARKIGALNPEERLRQLAVVRNSIQDIADRYVPGGTYGAKRVTADEADMSIRSAADSLRSRLNTQVEFYRDRVINAAGEDGRYAAAETVDTLRTILRENGATFDKDGTAKITGRLSPTTDYRASYAPRDTGLVNEAGQPITRPNIDWSRVEVPGAPVREPIHPVGVSEGKTLMGHLADDYNRLVAEQAQGGIKAKELFDTTSFYQDTSAFEQLFGTRATTISRKVGAAAASDRDRMAMQLLTGEEGDAFKAAYKEYTTKTDYLRDVEKLIRKEDNAQIVAEAVIRPRKAEDVSNFKKLFGGQRINEAGVDESAWGQVRSYFIDKLFNDHIDGSTGVLEAGKLMNTLKKYGDDVLNQVFEPGELGQIRKIAAQAGRIQTNDLMSGEQYAKVIQGAIGATAISKMSPVSAARLFWGLSKPVPQAADYLLDQGFLDMARTMEGPRKAWLGNVIANYRSMYELAIRRKLPNGREVFADVNRSGGLPGAIAGTAARHIGVAGAEDAIRPNPGAYPNPSPNAGMDDEATTVQDALRQAQ